MRETIALTLVLVFYIIMSVIIFKLGKKSGCLSRCLDECDQLYETLDEIEKLIDDNAISYDFVDGALHSFNIVKNKLFKEYEK